MNRSLREVFSLVWSGDPALDIPDPEADAEGHAAFVAKWEEYLQDLDHTRLPLKAGMQPAIFHFKPLPMKLKLAFQDRVAPLAHVERPSAAAIWGDIFQASVRSWSGGFMAGLPPAVLKKGPGAGGEVLADDSFDGLPMPLVLDLGPRLFELATLGP